MIDTLYQGQINKALDDQVQRPSTLPAPGPSTFAGFWRGLGGIPGGAALGFGSFADAQEGMAKIDASQGLVYNPGTRTYTRLPLDDSSLALQKQIKTQGIGSLFTSETGNTLRAVAKDYMPDAQTTGAAGQILANGASFLTQAGVAMGTSGPIIGAGEVGALSGMQEADRLREQGVDQRTREQAGMAVGVGTGASMLLPMSGASALTRFAKGAVGGAASYAAQTEAEKLILQRQYPQLAAQFDPLDPTGLAISAGVPGLLGAALGHTAAGKLREPNAQDVAFTPAEQAHSDAVEASTVDTDIAAVQKELTTQKDEGARQVLQGELDKLLAKKRAGGVDAAMAADPNLDAAARVSQTARAMDSSRLTPDDDLVGRDQHQRALETAADQMGAGDQVDVSNILGDRLLPGMLESRELSDHIDALEDQRAQLLGGAGNQLGPGEAAALHQQVAQLQSQLTDVSAGAVKARAAELQGPGISYKQASTRAQRELSGKLADQQATIERLRQQLEQHASAAQASERISGVERDLTAARERQAQLPGPATTPRRLSVAMQDVYRELGRAPVVERTRANPDAFHTARAEAEAGTEAVAGETKPATGETAAPERAAPAPAAAPKAAVAGPSDAHLEAAVAQLDPHMLVHVEGMAEPMRLEDLMDAVRADAAQQGKDSTLLEIAAQCAISFGTAG